MSDNLSDILQFFFIPASIGPFNTLKRLIQTIIYSFFAGP